MGTHCEDPHGHDVQLCHVALGLESAAERAYGHIIVVDLLVRLQSACCLELQLTRGERTELAKVLYLWLEDAIVKLLAVLDGEEHRVELPDGACSIVSRPAHAGWQGTHRDCWE